MFSAQFKITKLNNILYKCIKVKWFCLQYKNITINNIKIENKYFDSIWVFQMFVLAVCAYTHRSEYYTIFVYVSTWFIKKMLNFSVTKYYAMNISYKLQNLFNVNFELYSKVQWYSSPKQNFFHMHLSDWNLLLYTFYMCISELVFSIIFNHNILYE